MNNYILPDPWKIIEDQYRPETHPITESLMSIGNGRMGQRANFAESYSGASLQGNYIAGVYYPDKTRVGWWKNGYPEYFAKVLNSVEWIKLKVTVDNEEIDLATANIKTYHRELNMQTGVLKRSVDITTQDSKQICINTERFYSLTDKDLCFIRYTLECSQSAQISIESYLNFDVRNSDANYDEDFWHNRHQENEGHISWVAAQTQKTEFLVCASASQLCTVDDIPMAESSQATSTGKTEQAYTFHIEPNALVSFTKCVCITSSFYYPKSDVIKESLAKTRSLNHHSFEKYKEQQGAAWKALWDASDVKIEGDISAQQGIRFNIFQLFQTYSGDDPRLNIGPKGFTGEKYGGSTYWDTEAYCLPFYLSTADESVAKNLLLYRYRHLEKAIENAGKLGFKDGAALYPMVTINGEECHNEWEITFEEIHRNGAIAFAIYNYVRYTGDSIYIITHGLEVLISISRFWSQRVHKSPRSNKYVMLGVTGPNEYENNVSNNWYTNYLARWCLQYTLECIDVVQKQNLQRWNELQTKVTFAISETEKWHDIIEHINLPYDEQLDIFIQHDGYLDNENITTADLPSSERPINQNWSWDRILRSPFIKQADVLQGLYFFIDHFTTDQIRSNFEYYEPRTVHESSLSPCVHGILAAKLGMKDKAYEMYLRTARLDLDNYNNDTEDGCHITSMAGTWMTIVEGFAGMEIKNDMLCFSPYIPSKWVEYSFKVNFRGILIEIKVKKDKVTIEQNGSHLLRLMVFDELIKMEGNSVCEILY